MHHVRPGSIKWWQQPPGQTVMSPQSQNLPSSHRQNETAIKIGSKLPYEPNAAELIAVESALAAKPPSSFSLQSGQKENNHHSGLLGDILLDQFEIATQHQSQLDQNNQPFELRNPSIEFVTKKPHDESPPMQIEKQKDEHQHLETTKLHQDDESVLPEQVAEQFDSPFLPQLPIPSPVLLHSQIFESTRNESKPTAEPSKSDQNNTEESLQNDDIEKELQTIEESSPINIEAIQSTTKEDPPPAPTTTAQPLKSAIIDKPSIEDIAGQFNKSIESVATMPEPKGNNYNKPGKSIQLKRRMNLLLAENFNHQMTPIQLLETNKSEMNINAPDDPAKEQILILEKPAVSSSEEVKLVRAPAQDRMNNKGPADYLPSMDEQSTLEKMKLSERPSASQVQKVRNGLYF